jgi:hypothetical protein
MFHPLLCLLLELGQLLLNGSDRLPKSRLLPHTALPQCDGLLAEVCPITVNQIDCLPPSPTRDTTYASMVHACHGMLVGNT